MSEVNSELFYLILAIATGLIAGLAVAMCRVARSPAPALATLFLYYWSLYGAWFLVQDQSGGDSGMHYHYLFDKLFPIYLNSSYLTALIYYAAFTIIIQVTFLVMKRSQREIELVKNSAPVLIINHKFMLVTTILAGCASIAIMEEHIVAAGAQGASAYVYTRSDGQVGVLFSVHQILNRIALLPAALGLAIWASGDQVRFLRGERGWWIPAGYAVLLSGMFVLCLLLGNKNELFLALVAGGLLYLSNCRRPRWVPLSLLGGAGITAISIINFARGLAAGDLSAGDVLGASADSALSLLSSNEAYGAHFSLYGAINYEIPWTWGTSFLSLAASVIPRAFWPERPDDIYVHYALGVHALEGQGYSIHHATGWYLNFGPIGIVLGAIIVGMIWIKLVNGPNRQWDKLSNWQVMFFAIVPCTFIGYLPSLIRAGPEIYKGVVLEAIVIPIIVLCFGVRRQPAPVTLLPQPVRAAAPLDIETREQIAL